MPQQSPTSPTKPTKPTSSTQTSTAPPKRKHKTPRPAPLSRRTTPQNATKLGAPKAQREAAAAAEERRRRRSVELEVEDAESFLNYCSFCERLIGDGGSGGGFLYCSEVCRQRDLHTHSNTHTHALPSPLSSPLKSSYPSNKPTHFNTTTTSSRIPTTTPPLSPFTAHFQPQTYYVPSLPGSGPDIIPRASPTISRPRSFFSSEPFINGLPNDEYADDREFSNSLPYNYAYMPNSERKRSSTALASLRELSSALEKSSRDRERVRTNSKDDKESERERRYREERNSRDSRSSISSSDEQGSSNSPTATTTAMSAAAAGLISKSSSGFFNYMTSRMALPKTGNGSDESRLSRTFTSSSNTNTTSAERTEKGERKGRAKKERWSMQYETLPRGGVGAGMDRPLPPRTEGYQRTRSIDLLTPL